MSELTKAEKYVKNPYVIVVIIASILWLVYRGKAGIMQFDKATFYYIAALGALAIVYLTDEEMKNRTPKIVTNDYHSTTNGEIIPVGNWGIIRCGDIDVPAFGFTFEGKDGCVIAPIETIHPLGQNIVVNVKVFESELDELPLSVQKEVVQRGLQGPYRIGYIDEGQFETTVDYGDLKKIKISNLLEIIPSQNKLMSMLDEISKGRFDKVEEAVMAMEKIGLHKSGSIAQRIKDYLLKENE